MTTTSPDLDWTPVRSPAQPPNGNWICRCGIGNQSHHHRCTGCHQPYEEIPDTDE